MVSDDEDLDCPLCMEEFDIADRNFRPCPCGYQICRFCWHHIKSNLNGRCPACRRTYSDQIVEFIPVSADEIVRFQKEKKEKERQNKDVKDSSRRHLSNVRVVQKNLVYVLGLSSKYASADNDLFKKHGKIAKLVVSKRTTAQTGSSSNNGNHSSVGIYVTYCRKEDAAKAIASINGSTFDGRSLRASYGTTKYCTYYLRHMACPNPNCMYLHEPGDDIDSYTKDTICKHPTAPAGGSSHPVPSKRPAPAANASTKPIAPAARAATEPQQQASSSTSTSTAADVPRKSAWAPIPKIVPPPPPPAASEQEPEQEQEPEPMVAEPEQEQELEEPRVATPEPVRGGSSEKRSKPIAIEKRPALPAAASWGKGTNNLASSFESATTPVNFGPSLSDATNASTKPKHSPTIPRRKEKKLKGKMVRLEDFEEGIRGATKATKARKEAPEPSALSAQIRRQKENEPAWQLPKPATIPKPEPVSEPAALPEQTFEEEEAVKKDEVLEKEQKARTEPEQEQQEQEQEQRQQTVEEAVKPEKKDDVPAVAAPRAAADAVPATVAETVPEEQMRIDEKKDVFDKDMEIEGEEDHDEIIHKPEARSDEELSQDEYECDELVFAEDKVVSETRLSPEMGVDQPSFTSYVLGNLMVDDVNEDEQSGHEDEGGLSSLKADLLSEGEEEQGRRISDMQSEKVQEDDFASPLAGLSSLARRDIVADSPDRRLDEFEHNRFPHQHQHQHHHHGISSSLVDDTRLPFDGMNGIRPHTHGPPPGFNGPPEWQSHNFNPFNGQDPTAARRLQHSQRMLEASGLFPGFGRPPPPPPSLFDFHGSGTPPPPPGMFGLPQPGMLRHPDFMNMPPGLGPRMDNPEMMGLENGMQRMSMHPNGREEPMRSMQDDLRALLPNANIKFGPMRDDDKPHTPEFRRSPDQEPPQDKVFFGFPNGSVHKPDAHPEDDNADMKQEAQNFFGEFLRKAAATTTNGTSPASEPKAAMPFQDPAIMSVRMSAATEKKETMTESQNAILQILGGQPSDSQRFAMMERALHSPPPQDMMPKPFDMFMPPPPQHPMPPPPPMPFHHRHPHPHHPPPPPPPFLPGFGEMPVGVMPPPPYHHHDPGMMHMHPPPPPPPLSMQQQMDLNFRQQQQQQQQHNDKLPPGLFPGGRGAGGEQGL